MDIVSLCLTTCLPFQNPFKTVFVTTWSLNLEHSERSNKKKLHAHAESGCFPIMDLEWPRACSSNAGHEALMPLEVRPSCHKIMRTSAQPLDSERWWRQGDPRGWHSWVILVVLVFVGCWNMRAPTSDPHHPTPIFPVLVYYIGEQTRRAVIDAESAVDLGQLLSLGVRVR